HWVAAQFERLTGLVKESVALNDDTQALILPLAKETATQEHPTFETRFTSANKPATVFRQQKIKTFFANNKMLLSLSLVGLLAITGWQFFLNDRIKSDHPIEAYSQSGEMKKGMEALKLYDRPGSLDEAEASFTRI